jgi:hypothetical protein
MINSEFLSDKIPHCMGRYLLVVFELPHGNWSSGNCTNADTLATAGAYPLTLTLENGIFCQHL